MAAFRRRRDTSAQIELYIHGLKKGYEEWRLETWNDLKKDSHNHPVSLEGLAFNGQNLNAADFSNCNLAYATFKESTLDGCDFSNSNLYGADFSKASLKNANFLNASVFGVDFTSANLAEAQLTRTNVGWAYIKNASLSNVQMPRAMRTKWQLIQKILENDSENLDLTNADLIGANLKNAFLKGAILDYTNLTAANLEGANLDAANATHAVMPLVYLRGASIEHIIGLDEKTLLVHRLINGDVDKEISDADLNATNLRGADLQGVRLENVNMSYSDLTDVNLAGAELVNVNLEGTDLEGANLRRTTFSGSILKKSKLINANLEGAIIENTNLQDAELKGAYLKSTNLDAAHDLDKKWRVIPPLLDNQKEGLRIRNVDLEGANLKGVFLKGAVFDDVNMDEVKFAGANLEGAIFQGKVRLNDADFTEARLAGARFGTSCIGLKTNFSKAELHDAVFDGARLGLSDFSESIIQRADLKGAEFSYSDFTGATLASSNLSRAILRFSRLSGADLSRCSFHGTNLESVDGLSDDARLIYEIVNGHLAPKKNLNGREFKGEDLSGGDFKEASLTNAAFVDTNLTGAILKGCTLIKATLSEIPLDEANLENCDLTRAKLKNTHLNGANLKNAILDYADLTGAVLNDADLENASIGGAVLSGIKWARAYTRGLVINNNVQPVGLSAQESAKWQLVQKIVGGTASRDLRSKDLSDANLKDAFLEKADFRDTNLQGAILDGANLRGVRLSRIDGRAHEGGAQFYMEVLPNELEAIEAKREVTTHREDFPQEETDQESTEESRGAYETHLDLKYRYQGQLYLSEENADKNKVIHQDMVDLNLFGLALAGGGIRSATFCLGVIQLLNRFGITRHIDYLSTVSGGGYIGACLSAVMSKEDKSTTKDDIPFHYRTGGQETQVVHHLRNSSQYLASDNFLGMLSLPSMITRGILTNLLVFFLFLFPVAWVTELALQKDIRDLVLDADAIRFDLGMIAGISLAFLVIILPIFHNRVLPKIKKYVLGITPSAESIRKTAIFFDNLNSLVFLLAISSLGAILLQRVLYFWLFDFPWYWDMVFQDALNLDDKIAFPVFSILSVVLVLSLFVFIKPLRKFLIAFLNKLLGIILLCAIGLSIFWGWNHLADLYPDATSLYGWIPLVLSLIGIGILFFVYDPNQASMHKFFRDRLSKAFMIREDTEAEEPTHTDTLLLSDLNSEGSRAPYHLVNVALNLHGSDAKDLRGRNADFFFFSSRYIGGPRTGYVKTKVIEEKDPHLNLGTAMAVSAAAAAPNMGTYTMGGLRSIITLLNIRLGYWLPNPFKVINTMKPADGEEESGGGRMRMGPMTLFYEFFGSLNEKRKYINLSDGGHIENMGIYELLRRRCKYIISVDGAADKDMGFVNFLQLIRYARIDMGIEVEIDLEEIREKKSPWALGRIKYGPDEEHWGYILYIKLVLTDSSHNYIRSYKEENEEFPYESIVDQSFEEAQFEVYRELGYQNAKSFFSKSLKKGIKRDIRPYQFSQLFDRNEWPVIPDVREGASERPSTPEPEEKWDIEGDYVANSLYEIK